MSLIEWYESIAPDSSCVPDVTLFMDLTNALAVVALTVSRIVPLDAARFA
ncbi:hypothetical protein [Adhaeretor mobilis]|uniref:Uncharacterized protein n=1 Tax=Adhaeretor mobilis TaxID=1930276 RepID=A0A517MWV2_9BACT|nr:hypothetical protein [Adhaeretor mobilis]QDS99351.1 hypothetical protein HG15A2_26740 [Adhaeretor mobilis]